MVTCNFTFLSNDGKTAVHAVKWTPDSGEYKAILQISHGMVEFIERYIPFAEFLTTKGYMVVGHDHIGHGQSVATQEDWGYFCENNPSDIVVADMHKLRTLIQEEHPGIPYFMLGHSMGSILLRQYIQIYGNELDGAILMGVVQEQPQVVLSAGKNLCRVMSVFRGWHYRSNLVDNMVVGSFNKKFQPNKTRADWVTSDQERLEAYCADPLCSFKFTVNAYYHMLAGMKKMQKPESVFMIPKSLPILLAAGTEDPCGGMGKGVRKIYDKYKKAGIKDVSLQLYAGDRHELLNETDRTQVYLDLYDWMESKISK